MDTTSDPSEIWSSAIRALDATALSRPHRAFLQTSRLVNVYGSVAVLAAPNPFAKDVLESRLRPPIESSLRIVLGKEVSLAVTVDPSLEVDEDLADIWADSTYADTLAATMPAPQPMIRPSTPRVVDLRSPQSSRLNPRYTFETFVAGASNRFAHAAAVAVAEQPARSYNPLVIYGESGLGKTHLLHAIGHYTQTLYSGTRVRYVSSEEFTNEFINSIRDDAAGQFQRRYRDVDVLLVDDIQFLSGKVQTQEEFFHTFNTLHNANKQIVITSDLPPKQLQDFEDRMRSRFEWGLITDIQPPDLETRIAILRKKTMQERREISDEVLEFIASKITSNIRELEGALIRISAFASLNSSPISVDLAEIVLKDLIPHESARDVTADEIKAQAATYFGISVDDLEGPSRSKTLVGARQIAMYLCRELTDLSLPAIGAEFGNRDHTTVMHADRKIRTGIGENRRLYEQVADLTNKIKTSA